MKYSIIELQISFEQPKEYEHIERIGNNLVKVIEENIREHFKKQIIEVDIQGIYPAGDDDER